MDRVQRFLTRIERGPSDNRTAPRPRSSYNSAGITTSRLLTPVCPGWGLGGTQGLEIKVYTLEMGFHRFSNAQTTPLSARGSPREAFSVGAPL